MPKDKNGKDISIGSFVTVRGKVVHLSDQPYGHNTVVELLEPLPGSTNPRDVRIAVGASQVEVDDTTSEVSDEPTTEGKPNPAGAAANAPAPGLGDLLNKLHDDKPEESVAADSKP